MDEGIALQQEDIDVTKRRPGFVSFQAAGNEETGTWCTVSTWENEEAATQAFQDAYGEDLVRRIVELVTIESSETYEVILSAEQPSMAVAADGSS